MLGILRFLSLFSFLFLASCKSVNEIEASIEKIQGQSAGYVLIPINDDLDSGYLITQDKQRFLVYGLPYVDENTEINSNDANGWNPAIVTNTYSVNALTYETLNMSLISSSQPNVSSSEVIMSKI